jgi:hypothetical protein
MCRAKIHGGRRCTTPTPAPRMADQKPVPAPAARAKTGAGRKVGAPDLTSVEWTAGGQTLRGEITSRGKSFAHVTWESGRTERVYFADPKLTFIAAVPVADSTPAVDDAPPWSTTDLDRIDQAEHDAWRASHGPDTQHEAQLRTLMAQLTNAGTSGPEWVSLTVLRERLPHLSRDEFDTAFRGLLVDPDVNPVPAADQGALTPADRAARLYTSSDRWVDLVQLRTR